MVAVINYANNIELHLAPQVEFLNVSVGCLNNGSLLASGNRTFGFLPVVAETGFYLNNAKGILVHGNNVNLFSTKAPVGVKY